MDKITNSSAPPIWHVPTSTHFQLSASSAIGPSSAFSLVSLPLPKDIPTLLVTAPLSRHLFPPGASYDISSQIHCQCTEIFYTKCSWDLAMRNSQLRKSLWVHMTKPLKQRCTWMAEMTRTRTVTGLQASPLPHFSPLLPWCLVSAFLHRLSSPTVGERLSPVISRIMSHAFAFNWLLPLVPNSQRSFLRLDLCGYQVEPCDRQFHMNRRLDERWSGLEEGKAGRQTKPPLGASNAAVSPIHGNFSEMPYFAAVPCILPRYIHRSAWGWAMRKSELQPRRCSASSLPCGPKAL